GSYSCQLDEKWFDLTKDTLIDALQITPVDNNNAFSSPPTPDVLIKFVNDLGYPKVIRTLSDVILWGVVNRAHIDYAKKMWEEFTQSIHTFIEDKKNLAQHTQGKKKATLIVIPSVRFTKLIIHHLQSKHKFHPRPGSPLHLPNEEYVLGCLKISAKGTKMEVFGMPIPNNLITADIQGEQYYNAYLEKVAKNQRYLAGEEVSDPDSPAPKPAKATKPKATKQSNPLAPKAAPVTKPAAAKAPKTIASRPPKPTPATTKPSKKDQSKKHKLLVDEFIDEGVPVNEPRFGDEEADLQQAVEESLKDVHAAHQGPLPSMVIREPESGKFQPLPETLKAHETESDEEVPGIDAGDQDECQAGPNPGIQDEGQARSNPGDAAVSQPQPSHVVHAGPNLEHMDVEVTDTSIQQNPEQIDEEFTTMAYSNVQENLKLPTEDQVRLEEPASSAGTLSSLQNLDKEFNFTNQFLEEKSQEDEPDKTNIESEVQSMVTVPIHQDTSSVPLMTTPVIDLTVSQPVSTMVQAPLPTSTSIVTTITTTTSLLPPPTQPQQGSSDTILIQRIGELEQHMADLQQDNLALDKVVDEIVTDAVDWAIQAPLKDRFKDLPEANMKEILHHRMWETKSYEAHEDHKNLKKKRRHESPKTPPGSPPHQPPPPPLPVGLSGTSVASGLSQLPPPPPPPSTNQSDHSKGTAAPSSSKTAPSAKYTAWTTIDTRLRPSVSSTPDDLNMADDLVPDKQVHSYDDEDIGNDHIPKVNLKHDWWKPLSKEDRPATLEPAWSIPSSDLPVPTYKWAFALASTYAPPPENSLLAQTGDMATFMDWYCK
ncbi:retrovirus-related pol polyprotein from transposon TNT 1-94, partial [Tanacetum coccineum]